MVPEDRHDRGGLRGIRLQLRCQSRGFVHVAAYEIAHRTDQQAERERYAPAPRRHLGVGQHSRENRREACRQEGRQTLAGELEAAEETLAPLVLLDQEGRGGPELAPGGEPLDQPREHDPEGRRDPEGRVARHHREQQRAEHHEPDRQHQCFLTAVAVRVRAEQQPAERPDQVRHAEHGVGLHQLDSGVAAGEERAADVGRHQRVQGEVEEFERVADAGHRDGTSCGGAVRCRGVVGVRGLSGLGGLGGRSGHRGSFRRELGRVCRTGRGCRDSGVLRGWGVGAMRGWGAGGPPVDGPACGTGRPPGPGPRGRSAPTGVRRGRVGGSRGRSGAARGSGGRGRR